MLPKNNRNLDNNSTNLDGFNQPFIGDTFLFKYKNTSFYYNGIPNVSIEISWDGFLPIIVDNRVFSLTEYLNYCIKQTGLENVLNIIPLANRSFKLMFINAGQTSSYTLENIFTIILMQNQIELDNLRKHLTNSNCNIDNNETVSNVNDTNTSHKRPLSTSLEEENLDGSANQPINVDDDIVNSEEETNHRKKPKHINTHENNDINASNNQKKIKKDTNKKSGYIPENSTTGEVLKRPDGKIITENDKDYFRYGGKRGPHEALTPEGWVKVRTYNADRLKRIRERNKLAPVSKRTVNNGFILKGSTTGDVLRLNNQIIILEDNIIQKIGKKFFWIPPDGQPWVQYITYNAFYGKLWKEKRAQSIKNKNTLTNEVTDDNTTDHISSNINNNNNINYDINNNTEYSSYAISPDNYDVNLTQDLILAEQLSQEIENPEVYTIPSISNLNHSTLFNLNPEGAKSDTVNNHQTFESFNEKDFKS